MATANISGDGKQKTFEQMLCSAGLTTEIHGQVTFLSVLNIFLSITAFLGNTLILAALCKETSLHPPSKLLLRSLAITDLCVGLISEPLYVTYLMFVVNEHRKICPYLKTAAFIICTILSGVSLLTLAAISVDRLLALLLGLRYRQVVTLKRTYVMVITFWVVSTVISTIYILNALIYNWIINISISLCLVTSIFSYTKIFLNLRHHQNQLQCLQQPNQTNPLNIVRYRKAVSSALWLQLTLVVCYLPHGIMMVFDINSGLTLPVHRTDKYTVTLVFLNSSLNPILYCWKIDEVRQAVKGTIRQVLCCLSS